MCRDPSGSNRRPGGGVLHALSCAVQVHSYDVTHGAGAGLVLGSCSPKKLSVYYTGERTLMGIATLAPGEGATDLVALPAA